MKTDRELLEAAARAAGGSWKWVTCPKFGEQQVPGFRCVDSITGAVYWPGWNPLADDGDALRLAVNLRLVLLIEAYFVRIGPSLNYPDLLIPDGATEDERCATTRRAIVMAAVQIGEQS